MMDTNAPPRDKYHGVWMIFFNLGVATVLPWNSFNTATMYFISRLKDPSIDGIADINETVAGSQNALQSIFSNVMVLSAVVPMAIFSFLNSILHQRIPQKLRILGSLTVVLVVFLLTAVLVKVEMAPLPFFCITIIEVLCINSFGAIFTGSVYGLAGLLPMSYTTATSCGHGLSGIVAAVSMICALATSSALQDSAFGFFISACINILLAIFSYLALPRLEFFRYYMSLSRTEKEDKPVVSVFAIFNQIWVIAISSCFNLTITTAMFPAITVAVTSTIADGGAWDTYFIPVSCFLLYSVMATVGRSLTAVCMWPGADSIWLPILVALRLVFVPLFMLCNVQPRHYLPVWFGHDSWYILFMILFAFSNGYLDCLCRCFGPKKVAQHEAETAGAIMVFFVSLGMVLGAAFSFAFKAMI